MSDVDSIQDLQRRRAERRRDLGLPKEAPRPRAAAALDPKPEEEKVRTADVELTCSRCAAGDGQPTRFRYTRLLAGDGKTPLVPDPDLCPACMKAESSRQLEAAAPRGEPANVLDLVAKAGGNPWKFGESSFASFRPWPGREVARDAAREFAESVLARTQRYQAIQGLILWGVNGRAKSEMAHCVLRELLGAGVEAGRGVLFVDWRSFVAETQGTYGRDSAWKVVRRCIDTDVLIIDDLFGGKLKPDPVDMAGTIINRREGRPTLITMNPDPAEVADLLTAAVTHSQEQVEFDADRLHSRLGAYRTVHVQGERDGRILRPVS